MTNELLSRRRSDEKQCVLRPARPVEGSTLSALARRAKQSWGYTDAFMQACRDELTYSAEQINSKLFTFVVAESAGLCVGFYALEHTDSEEVELEALFVDPIHHGRGIGRILLRDAAEKAARRRARTLVVQSDPNAADFYRSAGFTHRGERESRSIGGRYLPVLTLNLAERMRLSNSPRRRKVANQTPEVFS